jgi:hypothetical protein
MPGDDKDERRLRELLRDPRWSLPARPDAEARVRRAARRQRRKAAGAAVSLGAVVIAASVLPVTLTGGGPRQAASGHPAASRPARFTLPPAGAPGFPVSIYPPPSSKVLNLVGQCPGGSGLQRPPAGAGTAAAALRVVENLGRSFRSDLRLSDRAFWRQQLANWRGGYEGKPGPVRDVLYSGPLESYHQAFGPPDESHPILAGCGRQTAASTWVIITGRKNLPSLQGEYILIDRRGHLLLWYDQ